MNRKASGRSSRQRVTRRGRRPRIAVAGVAAAALAAPAPAGEVILQNDNGVGGAVCPCFVAGEEAAAWLTSPCSGVLTEIQIGWGSQLGGQPDQLEQAIHIYQSGVFPEPGPEITDGELNGPVLVDGFINTFDVSGFGFTVSAGQTIVVSLELANDSLPPFGPGPAHDTDGCQPGRNTAYCLGGECTGWTNMCGFISGDWLIRAVVDCSTEILGACCFTDGSCTDGISEDQCAAQAGTFQGFQSTCASVECTAAQGACCFVGFPGFCSTLTESDCQIAAGVWQGAGTSCPTTTCSAACCLADGSCVEVAVADECVSLGGTYQGDGTACGTVECPQPLGGCCLANGACLPDLTQANCQGIPGATWAGIGTSCDDANGNGTADDCEPPCPWDCGDDDGTVGIVDFLAMLAQWNGAGACDFGGDGVDITDFLELLANWGPCP